ncbi:hypothetical protein ACFOY2_05370 [Nonomuraea purpurea]|uniref:DUF3168 domain-containing protein n=1 Tax=Nonomuraea purpurea TaxID=1849276 RepID=A0ABV8G0A4_9ACTN
MTTLSAAPLIEALLAIIRAPVGEDCRIYWGGAAANAAPPYAVVYPDSGMLTPGRRTLANNGPTELRYQITSVGASPAQAQWVADKTRAAVLAGVPVVVGRRVWPTVEEGSQPLRRDDVSTNLWFATAQYLTRSDPV